MRNVPLLRPVDLDVFDFQPQFLVIFRVHRNRQPARLPVALDPVARSPTFLRVLNGVESFFEIRKIKPNANVVMMTAYSVRELLAQAIEGGALGVLHKPVGSKEFIKALDAER